MIYWCRQCKQAVPEGHDGWDRGMMPCRRVVGLHGYVACYQQPEQLAGFLHFLIPSKAFVVERIHAHNYAAIWEILLPDNFCIDAIHHHVSPHRQCILR